MGRCVIFTSLMLLLLMIIRFTEGIWLNLPSTGTKCVSEEILNNVVVVADYVIIDEQGHASPTVSAKVASPYGNNLHHKENVTHDLVNNLGTARNQKKSRRHCMPHRCHHNWANWK